MHMIGWALVALALSFAPGAARADTVIAAFGEHRPPFIIGSAEGGLEIDIVRAALKQVGHRLTPVPMPNARLKAIGARGWREVDAVVGVRDVYEGGYLSDSYIAFHNYAITKTRYGLEIDSVADLKGKTVVAWQNAWNDLGEAYRQLFGPGRRGGTRAPYYEHPDQRKQVEMFWKGRVDVLIIDKSVFLWQSRQLAERVETTEAVTYHEIFPQETLFYVAFKHEALRDDFNRGLRVLKESGLYQRLLARYLQLR